LFCRHAELKAKLDANDRTLHAEQRRRNVLCHAIADHDLPVPGADYPALSAARQTTPQVDSAAESQAAAAVALEVSLARRRRVHVSSNLHICITHGKSDCAATYALLLLTLALTNSVTALFATP
jgi:hypothetical protein